MYSLTFLTREFRLLICFPLLNKNILIELFKRSDIIHMTISVSRRLNILCIMFKIIAGGFFIATLWSRLYASIAHLTHMWKTLT